MTPPVTPLSEMRQFVLGEIATLGPVDQTSGDGEWSRHMRAINCLLKRLADDALLDTFLLYGDGPQRFRERLIGAPHG